MLRILCCFMLIFALVGCSDDSESKDAAVMDAAVDASAQLEASSADSVADVVVTDSVSDTDKVDASGE